MSPADFNALLDAYRAGSLTGDEHRELADLLHSASRRAELEDLFDEALSSDMPDTANGETLHLIFQRIRLGMSRDEEPRTIRLRWPYWAAASVAGLLLVAGVLWRARRQASPAKQAMVNVFPNDVLPGGDHAVLTLADGSRIVLDSAGSGDLVKQGGSRVIKIDAGHLAYTGGAGNASDATWYNTLSTPVGGQFELTLPDGSRVWLNAASSITYPTTFNGRERRVRMTGEAYLEIANRPSQPFVVEARDEQVQVLGTRFNINVYPDEPVAVTTLVQGAVRVTERKNTVILQHGQQAQVGKTGGITVIPQADLDQAVGWKDGLFKLHGTDVPALMRQIARWYNVEVVYEGPVRGGGISGDISRNMTLSKVLKVLEISGVHCRIEGKTLYVSSNGS